MNQVLSLSIRFFYRLLCYYPTGLYVAHLFVVDCY